ncbi:hypothetical protein Tco_0132958 [Tanacetum coccineum]
MEKKDTLSSCSDSEIQQMQLIQDKTKESCMVSFQRLHSHLKCLLNNDLKGSRTEDGFKRAFTTLFCQDLETFTGTMFLNVDQLEKQLDNKEFQEIGSMASFKVLETQFQMFINSQIYLNDEYIVMTRNYFLEYTRLDIPEFRDTLIQNMDYVKKSIEKRALHKMEYDSRVNERLMQTTEEKVDSSKALDASLVIIESNGTESQEQDTSSRSGNDAHVDDADIRPIYNEEPMAEVQTTAEINTPLPLLSQDSRRPPPAGFRPPPPSPPPENFSGELSGRIQKGFSPPDLSDPHYHSPPRASPSPPLTHHHCHAITTATIIIIISSPPHRPPPRVRRFTVLTRKGALGFVLNRRGCVFFTFELIRISLSDCTDNTTVMARGVLEGTPVNGSNIFNKGRVFLEGYEMVITVDILPLRHAFSGSVHVTNSCHLDTTRHHPAAAVAGTVVAEVGTADSLVFLVGRNQGGCKVPCCGTL